MEHNQQTQLIQQPSHRNLPDQQIKDKIIDILVKEIEKLKKEIDDIKNNKIVENLQVPEKKSEKLCVLKIRHRLRTNKGWRPLLESEIDEAQKATENAKEAAKYLGISYRTYKKWCLIYNKLKINPWGKGSKKKYWDPSKGKYPLNKILEGQFPNYPIFRLKDLLIRSGIKDPCCEVCGFNERRITDQKMPLLVNFLDGNEKNHKKDNLQILCYNHYFIQGRGYIRRGKVEFNFLDPDRIQGSSKKIDARF